jgi:hypothetical protein
MENEVKSWLVLSTPWPILWAISGTSSPNLLQESSIHDLIPVSFQQSLNPPLQLQWLARLIHTR